MLPQRVESGIGNIENGPYVAYTGKEGREGTNATASPQAVGAGGRGVAFFASTTSDPTANESVGRVVTILEGGE